MHRGKSYAIVGASGSGKSSILALLQRFYDPTQGAIYLDGIDIRNTDLGRLRGQMGYVSEDPVLFDGSIRWNVAVRHVLYLCISGSLLLLTVTRHHLAWG